MLGKTSKSSDARSSIVGEPLFLRVSPGGVAAISLTPQLRNGIHPWMVEAPAPPNYSPGFSLLGFISDNLQDEFAIDIYRWVRGRLGALVESLKKNLPIPAQGGGEIEFSTGSDGRMNHIQTSQSLTQEAARLRAGDPINRGGRWMEPR